MRTIFLQIMKRETSKVGKHDQAPVPLENEEMSLPNNRKMMEQRLFNLTKRFQRNYWFKEDHNTFLEEIINKSYAKE